MVALSRWGRLCIMRRRRHSPASMSFQFRACKEESGHVEQQTLTRSRIVAVELGAYLASAGRRARIGTRGATRKFRADPRCIDIRKNVAVTVTFNQCTLVATGASGPEVT